MKALRVGITLGRGDYWDLVLAGLDNEDRPFRLALYPSELPLLLEEVQAILTKYEQYMKGGSQT